MIYESYNHNEVDYLLDDTKVFWWRKWNEEKNTTQGENFESVIKQEIAFIIFEIFFAKIVLLLHRCGLNRTWQDKKTIVRFFNPLLFFLFLFFWGLNIFTYNVSKSQGWQKHEAASFPIKNLPITKCSTPRVYKKIEVLQGCMQSLVRLSYL